MTINWPPNVRVRPIVMWPGSLTRNRQRSNFSANFSGTVDLLWRELHQLHARNVVLQIAMQERDFRLDGYPRATARAEHPGIVLSLDSKHGPLSYPCDRFTDWQDNLRAVALALEALRKVDRYGVTKHGEQYTGWKQLPGRPMPKPMTPEDAVRFLHEHSGMDGLIGDRDRFTEAYRIAARRLHPDAGGTTEDFQRLQEAKHVLDGVSA